MHPIFKQRQIRVDYDTEYGIEQRTGWSVAIDGSYIVQFERFLLAAIAKAIWRQQKLEAADFKKWGAQGGAKSKRVLTSAEAKVMVAARERKRRKTIQTIKSNDTNTINTRRPAG